MTNDDPRRFSDALVSEIKAEMGRQDLSSRALGRLIGASSQFISARLDGGNPRTGERVLLTVKDLASIAEALQLSEVELVARAQSVARRSHLTSIIGDDSRSFGRKASHFDEHLPAAARQRELEETEEQ